MRLLYNMQNGPERFWFLELLRILLIISAYFWRSWQHDQRNVNFNHKHINPLPRIDDTLDSLTGAKWLLTLDLKTGYWLVEIHPAIFEELVDTLYGLNWKNCLIYLDDVIIIGKTFEGHLKNVKGMFGRLSSAKIRFSLKMCNLFCNVVKYLGHVINEEHVANDAEKDKVVRKW